MDAVDESPVESEDRAVQTDDISTPPSPVRAPSPVPNPPPTVTEPAIEAAPMRTIEECLDIAKSEVNMVTI
jgi:hypothetical protein